MCIIVKTTTMNNFVIIVNYFGDEDTINCIQSVITSGFKINILVIDNGSKINFETNISKLFPNLVYIKNLKNLGFAAGNNIGIKYAMKRGAKNIVLLNNDTVISKKSLGSLIENRGDIVGAVLKFRKNNKTFYDLGGFINWWIGRNYHKEVNAVSQIYKTNPDYVSGALMLIRKNVIDKIGLFDERYFLYYEDADYCIRAKNAGFKIKVDSNVIISHKLGATLGRKSFFTLYHNLRSNLIFIFKNIPITHKPFALIYWILLCVKVTMNWFLSKE